MVNVILESLHKISPSDNYWILSEIVEENHLSFLSPHPSKRTSGRVTKCAVDRKQFVQFNGYCSSTKYIKCGVSQGSILGPLLVLLCINDICEVSSAVQFILFADTNVFSYENPDFLLHKVNLELSKLNSWLNS